MIDESTKKFFADWQQKGISEKAGLFSSYFFYLEKRDSLKSQVRDINSLLRKCKVPKYIMQRYIQLQRVYGDNEFSVEMARGHKLLDNAGYGEILQSLYRLDLVTVRLNPDDRRTRLYRLK